MVRRIAMLLGMTVVQVAVFLLTIPVLVLSFGLGLVPLFPPHMRLIRRLADTTRRSVGIASPYLPPPPPPRPGPDGMYRSDRTLYKTPRIPAWNDRWKWLFSDPATWRDAIWLLLDPLVKVLLLPVFLLMPRRGLRVYTAWAAMLLASTAARQLEGQVEHLTQIRSMAVDNQAAEMRRIERDLHDGAQARLVALGMTLGAVEELVEKDPGAAKALLRKAREVSSDALTELRQVVRGIHPPVLAERGLEDAVRAMAMDSPLRVKVDADLPHRAESPVEAAVYFAISELLSNAARHGGATEALIDISHVGRDLRVTVADNGLGGADPSKGSGLYGIERRLSVFDGVVALHSPPGGPTTVTLHVPKVLPEHWAGDSKMPRWKTAAVILLWGTAWCPLFPQGIVAAIMLILGKQDFSWFLVTYLPPGWQWPTCIFLIMLGTLMYVLAILLPLQHSKEARLAGMTPRGLGLGGC
ncbi:sensor histidine kinase [Nonomuraea soli]|uniref:histidine kinase n=1 Tax=Nonomuraea soli TaxID=1032476 RepID=A0A7W0CIM0_9ACTN|nr:histidine kinase [Nonomuraea soli]MBA2891876.1 signal transduction histidine kinase [Nonomuraea soli]